MSQAASGPKLSRWCDLVIYAATASATLMLAGYWFSDAVAAVVEVPRWVTVATGLWAIVFWQPWSAQQRSRRWGLRHFTAYPPLWFASLLGGAIALSTASSFPDLFARLGVAGTETFVILASWSTVAVVAFVGGASLLVLRPPSAAVAAVSEGKPREDVGSPLDRLSSYERIKEWVLSGDDPLTESDRDLFGHRRVASRIADRLIRNRNEAQMVVGALGSGKSSVRALATNELERRSTEHRLRVVSVQLWQYETTHAAVRGVIDALIDELSRDVDVTALRGLSSAYTEAIGAMGGYGSVVARLLQPSTDPVALLNQIDRIAAALERHYVIWVEDLERFALGKEGESTDETLRVRERLSPLTSLIYNLDQLDSVVAVTATISFHARFDREKITRYVEELPELERVSVAHVLHTFRQGCRGEHADIDPADEKAREVLDRLVMPGWLESHVGSDGRAITDAAGAITHLCATPRILKHALLRCHRVWEKLHGEIAFDDLLVMSVLFAAWPDGFAFVRDRTLRNMHDHTQTDSRKSAEQLWSHQLGKLTESGPKQAVLKHITQYIFGSDKPQGFNRDVYWKAFLTEPDLRPHERDQNVLRAMRSTTDEELVEFLTNEQQAAAIEYFNKTAADQLRLTSGRLKQLLPKLVQRLSECDASAWPPMDPPGVVPLWRMWNDRQDLRGEEIASTVVAAVDSAIKFNLGLADSIGYFFTAHDSEHVPDLLGGKFRSEVRRTIQEKLATTYSERPELLAANLHHVRGAALLRFCWGLDRVKLGLFGSGDFPGWKDFASTVLEATRQRPEIMLEHLASFVMDSQAMSRGAYDYKFNEARAQDLFGDEFALLRIFAGQGPERWAENRMLTSLILEAQQRLSLPSA